MSPYWCCELSHVANDTEYRRRFQALAQSDFAPDASQTLSFPP